VLVASALTLLALPLLIRDGNRHGSDRPTVAAISTRSDGVTGGLAADTPPSSSQPSSTAPATTDVGALLARAATATPVLPTTTLPVEPTTTYPDGTSSHRARPAPIVDLTKPATGTSQEGMATYRLFGDPNKWGPRPCADATLAKGSYLTVTNLNTGKSTTCLVVEGIRPAADHIIELDASVFAELADTSAGEIPVRVSW